MLRNLGIGTASAIVVFIAVAFTMMVANAIQGATRPVPGWVPTPSVTSK